MGVVGAITPWNYPFLMAVWKVVPAIAAGCTVVLKGSELAPLSCLVLAEMVTEAGLPAGALNVLSGLGPDAGAPLSAHQGVDKVCPFPENPSFAAPIGCFTITHSCTPWCDPSDWLRLRSLAPCPLPAA